MNRVCLVFVALTILSIREFSSVSPSVRPERYAIRFNLSKSRNCPGRNCAYAVEVNVTILVAARIKSLLLQCDFNLKLNESRTRLRKRYRNGTFEEMKINRHVYKRGIFVSTVEIEAQLFQTRRAAKYLLMLSCEKNIENRSAEFDESSDNEEYCIELLISAIIMFRMFVSTYTEPQNVHHTFPCLNDPTWPSTFDLEIIHLSSHRAVASTALSKRQDFIGHTTKSMFKRTKKMPAHHLFFAVWNYEVDSSEAFYDVWRRPKIPAQNLQLFVVYAKKSFEFMINATANRYPVLPKMNLVAYSGFEIAGWYSSVSATLFRESSVVLQVDESTTSDRFEMVSSVTRAVVSQWIGVLIYPKSWSHSWLYQALANYVADLVVDKVEPTWRVFDQRLAETILWSGIEGEYPSSPAMKSFLFDIWNNRTYLLKNHLIVRQATAVVRLIHNLYDYAEIDTILKKFLENWFDNKYEARPAELASDYMNSDTFLMADNWLRNSGIPVLHVLFNASTSEIELRQERFYALGPWSKLQHYWMIPIRCYEIKSEVYRHEWVFPNATKTKVPYWMKWCLINGTSAAPFRVNYPVEWWMEISKILETSPTAINEMQRMRLIDDALALVLAGYREPEIFFNLTRYLKHEVDYFPWLAAAKSFKKLRSILKYSECEECKKKLQVYVLQLLSKVHDFVGLKPDKGKDYVVKLHRKNIMDLACAFGHEECLSNAKEKMHCILDAMESAAIPWIICSVDSDIREIVFCQGLRRASPYTWKRIYNLLSNTHLFHAPKSTIKLTLGCTEDPKILQAYIDLVLEDIGNFPEEEMTKVFLFAARINEENAQIVLKKVVAAYELIRARSHFPGKWDRNIHDIVKEVYTYRTIHHILLPFLRRNSRFFDVSLMYNTHDQATANIILTKEARPVFEQYLDRFIFP